MNKKYPKFSCTIVYTYTDHIKSRSKAKMLNHLHASGNELINGIHFTESNWYEKTCSPNNSHYFLSSWTLLALIYSHTILRPISSVIFLQFSRYRNCSANDKRYSSLTNNEALKYCCTWRLRFGYLLHVDHQPSGQCSISTFTSSV